MRRGLEEVADGATIRPTARASTHVVLGREGNRDLQGIGACVTGSIAGLLGCLQLA